MTRPSLSLPKPSDAVFARRTGCLASGWAQDGRVTEAEPAARRWFVRYLSEGMPSLRDVAKVKASASAMRVGLN